MNLTILSTYPPRECGIASFSKDLKDNLTLWEQQVSIIAINDGNTTYEYPREVIFEITEDRADDYQIAAEFINNADVDVVFIEHEYGIFGGDDGSYVLNFASNLDKPFILNTHTVLSNPEVNQKSILSKLGQKSIAVICMTNRSAELMNKIYKVPLDKIYVIPHGVPVFKVSQRDALKEAYDIAQRPLVTTFGFIGPGKGIELGIKAISHLQEKYPDIVYLVAGETHPKLKLKIGEVYRDSLIDLIESLGLGNNIKFINRYISLEELGEILYMTDVYLTPYPNRNQAVSGTLSYAIGCGRAIVSTPYDYSLEVLADGKGLISSEAEPSELAMLIDKVLSEPKLKAGLEAKAAKLGKTMVWPNVGKSYVETVENILNVNVERKVF
ncbi:MAG: glycosyltransferase family 4 protein [Tepidanaerobacteraceae bacterium]